MTLENRLVTAEITGGLMPPTIYSLLPKALDALWFSLQFQPISRPQWLWFERYLTGPSADRFVADYRTTADPLDLPVVLPSFLHHLRLHWTPPGGNL
ncbi:hypothetical protein [Kitasatospora sp. NPDC097643]|uniref:hypothetical protein n=1 Tax=Kitasatospora sp. NPDC097643 TaxID=3157230 RepID=UPI0033299987